jgi:hypothetical protein
MKDSKSLLLLVVSVLLILVSFALLWSWGYNLGNEKSSKSGTVYILKDSTAAAIATRDSLNKIYKATIQNLGSLDSTLSQADSIQNGLAFNFNEFYKLRTEIADLLKNPANKPDIDNAKLKIAELQSKVNELKTRNAEVENENRRLNEVLAQLTRNEKQGIQNSKADGSDNAFDKTANKILFNVSDIKLQALMVFEGKEEETVQALQTDKFTGSFLVSHNLFQTTNAEMMVVLLQPDGKVLKTSPWESGSFETKEGRKIYSCRLRFDYSKGETKRLSFSLNAEKCMKGNYTVQLYQNGQLLGKLSKTLI